MLYRRLAARLRRLVFAAALMGLATLYVVGLAPAASPALAPAATPALATAATQAAVGSFRPCRWEPTPSRLWLSDPGARINVIGGRYNLPGQTDVAYKLTGEAPHAVYYGFTTYDDLWQIPGANYVRNGPSLVPDAGSINPFIPGNLIAAPNRSYTLWLWPDSVPVPPGLEGNVMPYPTHPQDPLDPTARWSVAMRQYGVQPGFLPIQMTPTVTAVSTKTLQPVRCPLMIPGTYESQIESGLRKISVIGPIVGPPPAPDNKIYFTRIPGKSGLGLDGYPADGCVNYVLGKLSTTQLSVVTWHKVPGFFDNRNLPPGATMQDNNTAYNSLIVAGLPFIRGLGQFQSPLIQQNEQWTSVWMPGQPNRLSPAQRRAVQAKAASLGYTVTQVQPDPARTPLNPLGAFLPYPDLILRQKAISDNFNYGINQLPCWVDPSNPETAGNNWLDFDKPKDAAWWAKYGSNTANMGPYYIDGVKESVAQFLQRSAQ
jgi:hypothetical protein